MDVGATQATPTTARHLAVPRGPSGDLSAANEAKLRKAAQDFESILVRDMIKTMRQATPGGKGILTGVGSNAYQDMMDDELAKSLSRKGGLGFADVMVRALSRNAAQKKVSSRAQAPPMGNPSATPTVEETSQ